MLVERNDLWSLADSTVIRMPLSSEYMKDGADLGSNRIRHITDIFMKHGSRALLFLKSVLQVNLLPFSCIFMQHGRTNWI